MSREKSRTIGRENDVSGKRSREEVHPITQENTWEISGRKSGPFVTTGETFIQKTFSPISNLFPRATRGIEGETKAGDYRERRRHAKRGRAPQGDDAGGIRVSFHHPRRMAVVWGERVKGSSLQGGKGFLGLSPPSPKGGSFICRGNSSSATGPIWLAKNENLWGRFPLFFSPGRVSLCERGRGFLYRKAIITLSRSWREGAEI